MPNAVPLLVLAGTVLLGFNRQTVRAAELSGSLHLNSVKPAEAFGSVCTQRSELLPALQRSSSCRTFCCSRCEQRPSHLCLHLHLLQLSFVGPLAQSFINLGHDWDLLAAIIDHHLTFGFSEISHEPQDGDPHGESGLENHTATTALHIFVWRSCDGGLAGGHQPKAEPEVRRSQSSPAGLLRPREREAAA